LDWNNSFFFVYFVIIIQIIAVIITYDLKEDSNIILHQLFFYITAILAIASHLKASFTNPGKIIHYNNFTVINFYLNTRAPAMKNAEKFNKKLAHLFFKESDDECSDEDKKAEKKKKKKEEEESDESSYDELRYRPVSAISEGEMNKIAEEYKIELNRCKQCYVVRVLRSHHCSKCKGCNMKMDHHCPWINNCVGQFNQKFFLLFCTYCLIGCFHASIITGYYWIYKNKKEFLDNITLIVFISIQLFFALIFIIFNICMLSDQWNSINNDTTCKL